VGWKPSVVGHETLGADMESPSGSAFRTRQPVMSNHLESEQGFRTPPLLAEHGVRRAITVPVPTPHGRPWGVLEADSPDGSEFDGADTEFMQGMAQLLGGAIERKRLEDGLRASERQFRTMADALPQLVWIADGTGSTYWYNQRWYEYTGTTPEEMQGWGWSEVVHPDHAERVLKHFRRSFSAGEPWGDTYPLRAADGQYRWFLSRATPIRDADGRVVRWFGSNTDVTEKKKLEEFQRMLLREVSHRVKNSLAQVSALLNLQSRNLEGDARRVLEEASSRVRTVATVHDQLWRQADVREIDLAPFLSNLVAAIAVTAPQHATTVEAEPVVLSADKAIPIGLFVNELVTNAYKHAYPEGQEGEVRVIGTRMAGESYRLEVSDAGRGLPHGFDLTRSRDSLGMRVVTSLAMQLNGKLTASSAGPGARFTLTFPLQGPSPPGA
jgi:PAS domain S-box-containing protein